MTSHGPQASAFEKVNQVDVLRFESTNLQESAEGHPLVKEAPDDRLYFRFGSSNIPHFKKREKGGEDAWYVQEDMMVVADGVGGWEAHGYDSGLFSK